MRRKTMVGGSRVIDRANRILRSSNQMLKQLINDEQKWAQLKSTIKHLVLNNNRKDLKSLFASLILNLEVNEQNINDRYGKGAETPAGAYGGSFTPAYESGMTPSYQRDRCREQEDNAFNPNVGSQTPTYNESYDDGDYNNFNGSRELAMSD